MSGLRPRPRRRSGRSKGRYPVGPDSAVHGAAELPGAQFSTPLRSHGYVEEEYLISGTAAAYRHGASGPEAITSKLLYTTRIALRRPADPAKFSGLVHFEPIHPTGGVTFSWLAMSPYIMSSGDIYVAVGLGDAESGHAGGRHPLGRDASAG